MSHLPECEITKANGRKCTRWVDEPGGCGTAKMVDTAHGPKWVCRRCMIAAGKLKERERAGLPTEPAESTKVDRNAPCPCGCGKKSKRCPGK